MGGLMSNSSSSLSDDAACEGTSANFDSWISLDDRECAILRAVAVRAGLGALPLSCGPAPALFNAN
jgi:hypothetical protein